MRIKQVKKLILGTVDLVIILAIAFSGSAVVFAAESSPFLGKWVGYDPDGSETRLIIAGRADGPFQITSTETYIGYCGGKAGIVRGSGRLNEADPNILEASLHLECFKTGAELDFTGIWRYHPTTNTLSSRWGSGMLMIWHPAGRMIQPPALSLRVNYGHNWVESFYETGHTVWVTVTEGDGMTVKATAEASTWPKEFLGWESGFQTSESVWYDAAGNPLEYPPDIQPYDWVYGWVDNGASAQVQVGDIRGEVRFDLDTITGAVDAPWITTPVSVECLDWGSGENLFNKNSGEILTDNSDPYTCAWDPATEWDIQPWQDIGVGYVTPEGHWIANAFRDERWMAMWTYDAPPGFWPDGEYVYQFEATYTIPEPGDHLVSAQQHLTITSVTEQGETFIYPGYALINVWAAAPQMAWVGSSCEVIPYIHPDQKTRLVWGWVNDYSMSYNEAMEHFGSIHVTASWEGSGSSGSAELAMGELLPFTNRGNRWEYRCSLTEHPPRLDLRVNYGDNWVESFYESGHNVRITVTEGDEATIKGYSDLVTEPKPFWDGGTGFQTTNTGWVDSEGTPMENPPDIRPGDWVVALVDNGASARVQIGDIHGILDVTTNTISGTVEASWFSEPLDIECHPWGAPNPTEMKYDTVMPDGMDPYTCTWGGEWDIQDSEPVGVAYIGTDGHWVANVIRNPRFNTFPEQEYIEAWEWPEGVTVSATVAGKPECAAEGTPGYLPDNPWSTIAPISFLEGCDISTGDTVTLTVGEIIISHTVESLAVTFVDKNSDRVGGTAENGKLVHIWVHDFDGTEQLLTVENNEWLADFGAAGFDLQETMRGRAEIRDELGNSTTVDWSVPE